MIEEDMNKCINILALAALSVTFTVNATVSDAQYQHDQQYVQQEIGSLYSVTHNNYNWTQANKIQIDNQKKSSEIVNSNLEGFHQSFEDMTKQVEGLHQSFEDMAKQVEGSYAVSAAFTGLTEPHDIGKTSISIGLGNYRSANALAFGVGERFNENFTAKLGGAYNNETSSLSSYAGIGLDF